MKSHRRIFTFAALALTVCALVLVVSPEAFATALHAKGHAVDHFSFGDLMAQASVGLAGFRAEYDTLVARAAAKLKELKDDTPPDQARKIEEEHAELLRQIENFRIRAFDRMAADADRVRISGVHTAGFDNPDNVAQAIEGALVARMTGKVPEGAASEFMGRTLLEMGTALFKARGERVRWTNRDQLAERILARSQHTTSDFPQLLSNASNRVLHASYEAAATPLKQLARVRERNDFRPVTGVALSEAPRLLKVNESGEIKSGTRAEESRPRYSLNTYGRIFSISRNALINDDLGAFTDALTAFGQSAAQAEADELVALLAANNGAGVVLWDSKTLFHASHKNLAAATALSIDGISKTRLLMREQKGLDDTTFINVEPRHLLVPPALETRAEQLLSASLLPNQADDAVPAAMRNLSLHVEPRLSEVSNTGYYLFADPGAMPVLEISYLAGARGPQMMVREGFEVLGAQFRATLDFGAGVVEWRGAARNPGA